MKIGTRSSVMALAQTNDIIDQLRAVAPDIEALEAVRFKPQGDRDQTSKLARHGGKGGAFVGEIRDAVRAGDLDAAMHSLKDVPGDEEAPGLVLAAYLEREAVEDALVLHPDLPLEVFEERRGAGYKIGTNSVRRAAYMKRLYPDCEIIHYRGAADTRLNKLDERVLQKTVDGGAVGPADGLLMAKSGLERIGHGARVTKIFSPGEMLPAVGQGIVTVECAQKDWATRGLLEKIDHDETRVRALAERELLWLLDGHCNTPIGGYAQIDGDMLHLSASVLSLDGATILETEASGPKDEPRAIGRTAARTLLEQGAAKLIAADA